MLHNKTLWFVILLFICLIWGTQHPVLKILSNDFSPITLSLIKFSLASLALLPFIVLHKFHIRLKDLFIISLLSLIGDSLFAILNISGLQMSTASNSSILTNTWQLMLVILLPVVVGEKVGKKALLGMTLGFLGVILVFTQGKGIFDLINGQYFRGNVLILISALCIAVQTMFVKKYIHKYGSVQVAFCGFTATTLFLLILSFFTGDIKEVTQVNSQSLSLFLWIAVMTIALTRFIWYESIRYIGLVHTSAYILLVPISGVLFSTILLKDHLTPIFILAAALIIFGIYLVHDTKVQRK